MGYYIFLFAGKAYATFSLLFGFSFYIQFHNAEKRGIDFRGRFAWRMCLLLLFAQLHALFYNGDILLLYAVVGFALIPVCKLKDKTVFWIALILLLQPYEWGRAIYALINPDYVAVTGHFIPYAMRAEAATANGSFFDVLQSNIIDGQLYSNIWQVENGRLFQTAALFMFGMLLGRRKYLIKSEESVRFWKRMLIGAVIAFIPLYCLRIFVPDFITDSSALIPYNIAVPSYANFAFMVILVSLFTLLWFKKETGYSWQSLLIPYGRMSLTNYIPNLLWESLSIMDSGCLCTNMPEQRQACLLHCLSLPFSWSSAVGGLFDTGKDHLNSYGARVPGFSGLR